MRKEKNRRKLRIPRVRVDFGRAQILSGMNLCYDGTLTFFDENGNPVSPAAIEVDATYTRQKGPKTLARVGMDPNYIQLDQNLALSQYAYVFAIDTNTRVVGTAIVSITVSCLIRDIIIGAPRWDARLVLQDAFEFHEASEAPEKIGWCEMIGLIRNAGLKGRIALVVDAHLGELAALNSHKQAICRGFFVPEGLNFYTALQTLEPSISLQTPRLHIATRYPGFC